VGLIASVGGVVVAALGLLGLIACVRGGSRKSQALVHADDGESEGSAPEALSDEDADVDNVGASGDGELRELLADAERMEPALALPAPQQQKAWKPDIAQQKEAAQSVERILAARNLSSVLGNAPDQRRAEFRRLVRLLHPDKGLVAGARASLALRRLLESQRTLGANR